MIDITGKQKTLRTASATGLLLCSENTVRMIRENSLPKGNLFDVAKASGLLASKKTSDLIPHCHPVSIDFLEIKFEVFSKEGSDSWQHDLFEHAVSVKVNAKSIGRTGIEMEVLTALSVTLLTMYDLLKPIDKNMEISSIKLTGKTGGKSDSKLKFKDGLKACILVCSDSTFKGNREDSSGKIIQEMLLKYKMNVIDYKIVPDTKKEIQDAIDNWVKEKTDFIFTTGGTGLGPRDITTDVVKEIVEMEIPGIGERMREYGGERTPLAMLSRSLAGTIQKTIIVTLPGSSDGARESLESILPGLFHARKMMGGGGHS